MKRYTLLFLITVLLTIGYSEISLSLAERQFWINLGL